MSEVTVDFSKVIGQVKPMHCVNNGPTVVKDGCGTFEAYKALHIPYARNHDASLNISYGDNHTVDVNFVFPDFEKDVNDPAAYDFYFTDRTAQRTLDAGTKTFYRLGTRIENAGPVKYNTLPPKDFQKWAEICEHIIRHENEGWADGHEYGIEYWEIWNEPDLNENEDDKPTWGGTREQFFDFYETVAKHLKACFPKLKIGGPAIAFDFDWGDHFLREMKKRGAPVDFFSWHTYTDSVELIVERTRSVRRMLNSTGFEATESILNEWNYLENWIDGFGRSMRNLPGIKGAAFDAAVMLSCQSTPVDMLMYYDARPGRFNGLFEFYFSAPLKPYFAFQKFSELYALKNQVAASADDNKLSFVAAKDGSREAVMFSYYSPDTLMPDRKIELTLKNTANTAFRLFVLDEEHDMTEAESFQTEDGKISFSMKINTVAYLESI